MSHKIFRHVKDKHLLKWLDSVAGKRELSKSPTYKQVMHHIPHHNIRRWLIRGAMDEQAVTIGCAIARLTDGQLERRFARMLAGDRI